MRNPVISAAILLAGLLPVYAAGQTLPRGYHVVQVTQSPAWDRVGQVNRRGQVVFMRWPDVSDRLTEEIFVYDGRTGDLTQITDDHVQDVAPVINDAGVMCWSRGIGPIDPGTGEPTTEIVVRDPDGTITRLTDNDVHDFGASINILGQIAWSSFGPEACGGPVQDIYMFDGQQIVRITNDGVRDSVENQSPEINDLSEICWTKYDFCDPPPGLNFVSKIMLYSRGQTIELTDGHSVPQEAVINNGSQVYWQNRDLVTRAYLVEMWDNGVITRVTDDGANPSVNDNGHLAFNRWDPAREVWDVWLYRDDVWYRLAFDSFWNGEAHLNSKGEVAWQSGNFPVSDIRFMQRFEAGDLNCDGRVDAFDIEAFIFALFAPQEYLDRYPTCDPMLADTNADGVVDAFDIEPFLTILFE